MTKRMFLNPPKYHPELAELIRESIAAYAAMSPDQKAAMHKAQRVSFTRGNLALDWMERAGRDYLTPEEEAALVSITGDE